MAAFPHPWPLLPLLLPNPATQAYELTLHVVFYVVCALVPVYCMVLFSFLDLLALSFLRARSVVSCLYTLSQCSLYVGVTQ